MEKTMTASDIKLMTDGQIENVLSKLRDAMRKHRSEITSDVAQQVLGVDNLGMVLFAPFRERATAISKMIVRHVKVDRSREPQQVLDDTGRKQSTDRDVVDGMSRGEGEEKDVYFFKPEPWEYTRPGYMSSDDLDKAFERRNLKPDPYAQAQVNIDDPEFADKNPNGTHWKDADGKRCYATFNRWVVERYVCVFRGDADWGGLWWFGGVPQEAL